MLHLHWSISLSECPLSGVQATFLGGSSSTTIYDEGIGIDNRIMDRICDPFYSTKPKGEGTGLGLSISFGIIRNHGGYLSFDSIEGQYTKVSVDLPVE